MTQPPDTESPFPVAPPADSDQQSGGQFLVAVFAVPEERDSLLTILSGIPGLTPIDARVRLHDLPGLLPERLDRETAEQVVHDFQSAGVNAAAFDKADVPRMEHWPTVHHVRCISEGLDFVGTGGTTEVVLPWNELALVSIADVPGDHAHLELARPEAARSVESESGVGHGPEMWLVRDAPFQAWRIDHLAMNYEYLGDRMSTSTAANFRTFAEDLAQHAPATYRTPSARAFLQTQRAEEYRFDSREAHAKSVQLHLLLRRTMRDAS